MMGLLRNIIVYFSIIFLSIAFAEGRTRDEIAQELNARQQKITELRQEAKRYREEIEKAQKEERTLKTEIRIYTAKIRELQSEIWATEEDIRKTNLEIEKLELEVANLDAQIGDHKVLIGETLRTMYEDMPPNAVEFFLLQRNISEVFGVMEYRRYLNAEIYRGLSNLKELVRFRTQEKEKQEGIRGELTDLNAQLAVQNNVQVSEKKEREFFLKKTRNEERKFKELLAENEALRKRVQEEILALEETLQLLIDPSRLPQKRSGVLALPLQGQTSQGYGKTAFARRTGFYKVHNGVDIQNKIGAPVGSAEYGKVIGTGDTDTFCRKAAYGKWILIEHENNLTTLYAHLSHINVKSEDQVERGGLIGYVGSTGLSTAPHLHFTVYDGKTVSIKESVLCGPLPIGGHINPMDYL